MGGLDSFCQIKNATTNGTTDPVAEAALFRLKATFRTIIVIISTLGVAGNVLNLITLRSPSLRNVPFMFIRALALFDLISLLAILLLFALETLELEWDWVIFYEVWVQDAVINSFLVAGLYCAVLLTIERFLLIRKPLSTGGRLLSIENTVLIKIGFSLLGAILLHLPMALQWQAKCAEYGGEEEALETGEERGGDSHQPRCLHWSRGKFNNRDLLCRDPFFALYNYYKMGRELLRFFCVLLLIVLNAVIARHLQMAKRKRRLLKRVSMATTGTSEASGEKQPINVNNRKCSTGTIHHHHNSHQQNTMKRTSPPQLERGSGGAGTPSNSRREQLNTLMRSFTEKKLTALMIAICVIFAIGNIPQMVVMAVQNETLNNAYSFQVFRQVANTLEVLNHCLNFFIFCMASSEYCRAFLSLSPVRWCLRHFPICASLARARLCGRLDNSPLVVNCNAGHESVSDCLIGQRKKSSIGTVLASSENGCWSASANGCSQSTTGPHRYRRDCWAANGAAGGGGQSQRGGKWNQRSVVGAVIVERKSSSSFTNGAATSSLEWPTNTQGASTTVQLVGPIPGGGISTEENGALTGGGGGSGGVGGDDFL